MRRARSAPPARAPNTQAARLRLPPRAEAEAVAAARTWYASADGKAQYAHRAGIEGTLSQGVRAFGLRRTRYWGLAKTHLQHVATAAAINVERIVAWLDERPLAPTRTSRFAALAPEEGPRSSRRCRLMSCQPLRDVLCSIEHLFLILYYKNNFRSIF